MLLSVRDNLKGTLVASIVVILFVIPLVLTGVGDGSFLGSAVGTDAASVDGKKISNSELRRAVFMRRQNMLNQQGVDASAEFLKEENLRGPVLETLTRRAALVVSAQKGGMGVSGTELDEQIRERPEFQVDGVFDPQTYRRLLANVNFTPASYKEALSEDVLYARHSRSINASSFVTEGELEGLVSLTQQKRSFFTVKIPKSEVEKDVAVSDEEISTRYEENKDSYVEEEKLTAQYVELSVDGIAKGLEVDEEEVKAQYESELANFAKTQEYEIAHILIEDSDDSAASVEEVSSKIKEGTEFSELVSQYSDDVGSKQNAGNLGVMTPGMFPEAFEEAVYSLEEGQISESVKTSAGTHFIKVLSKTVSEPPSFDARKDAIASDIKRVRAEEIFAENLDVLGELTFSAPDLNEVSTSLGLELKTTPAFTRSRGVGVAGNSKFRDAAYSDDVLTNGYNSGVIEISSTQVVVLRKGEHSPERTKELEEVKESIVASLTDEKVEQALTAISVELEEKLNAGGVAEEVAKEAGYEFKSYDKVTRVSGQAGYQVSAKAFSMALEDAAVTYDSVVERDGSLTLIGMSEVIPGQRADMPDQQFKGLTSQLNRQGASFEASSYESEIVANAEVDIY